MLPRSPFPGAATFRTHDLAPIILCLAVLASGAGTQAQARRPATLRFRAVVGAQPFSCGTTYQGIGTTRSSIQVNDFRLYVSDVALTTTAGERVPLTLSAAGPWQHDGVVLLDFEDASGECSNGTPEMRTTIEGEVPAGDYAGLQFTIGVPETFNHRDPTTLPSPLNLSRMFWTWNAGFKFVRLDFQSTGQPQGWMVHLGSTGCVPKGQPNVPATSCGAPNRVSVNLPSFDPDRDVVEIDLAALLADSDVDTNQPRTAVGCMSSSDDRDCAGLFARLGLPFGDRPGGDQRVVRVAPHAATGSGRQ